MKRTAVHALLVVIVVVAAGEGIAWAQGKGLTLEDLAATVAALTANVEAGNARTDQHAARLAALETAVAPTPTPTATATPEQMASLTLERRMNIRRGPGTQYEIIGTAEPGARFDITGKNINKDWWQIVYESQPAWVYAPYVTAIHAANVPVVATPTVIPTATPQPTRTPRPTPTATLDADAYFWRGYDRYEAGDYACAIAEYTIAIDLNPADADAYFMRGVAKPKLDTHAGAIADFTTAIGFSPDHSNACYWRGVSKALIEDHAGAFENLTIAIGLNPAHIAAYHWRGQVKYSLGQCTEANADLEKAGALWRAAGETFEVQLYTCN